ncbi:peptidase S41 [Streptomyces sp. D2-8]|uniref:S41 family peptidase n=1 Tax=Streptomyces sp. D2-8 TaxID=2707767 RepID=UPI0020BE624F|nr:S41 family peptidase [Streptomyces sp. D2-8]MCK8438092.1 peptidase S41 [Streptomyces sp. D2-8]
MSAEARSYLSTALDTIEKRSLMRHEVDWAQVRSEVFSHADGARNPEDTYGAIRSAVSLLHDGHSGFFAPEQAEELEDPVESFDGLRGRSLEGRLGYVSLPGVQGAEQSYEQYVRRGRKAVAEADRSQACGWVVDLRRNRGGNMWPMLAVGAPMLGDGKVGGFVDSDGERSVWTVEDGSPRYDGESVDRPAGDPVSNGHPPVAVLTGRATASSGEAVVVAFRGRPDTRFFGESTHGVPTGNVPHRLSDGAILNLTEAKFLDRTGRMYDAPIPPDEEVFTERRTVGTSRDRVLEAAKNWLAERPVCQ